MEETKKGIGEDWLALWTGLAIFVLGLGGLIGWEVLGWGIKTSVWVDLNKALSPISPAYKFSGLTSLFFTYLFLLGFMLIGARALGAKVGKFVVGFTLTFWISYLCWLIGHYAHIAATPDVLQKYNITWSLQLTGEAGFIVALLAGLVVG
ncbi:MAG: putative sulfate exporter family transporter, partial [Deltaproteobacteria bacterium]|nr:putative sulfate exporter family transporter [Deltaproteobacteria bacterium]